MHIIIIVVACFNINVYFLRLVYTLLKILIRIYNKYYSSLVLIPDLVLDICASSASVASNGLLEKVFLLVIVFVVFVVEDTDSVEFTICDAFSSVFESGKGGENVVNRKRGCNFECQGIKFNQRDRRITRDNLR
jgi:hypothetical protein